MADVDKLNQFPNSKMAQAVKLGQSRFISIDDPATTLFSQRSTIDNELPEPPPTVDNTLPPEPQPEPK